MNTDYFTLVSPSVRERVKFPPSATIRAQRACGDDSLTPSGDLLS
jgi:hypothetical protein